MIVGTVKFIDSLRRVANAAENISSTDIRRESISGESKGRAACRIRFDIQESCLRVFSASESLFANCIIPVEITDKDKQEFVLYTYPHLIIEHLEKASQETVEFRKYRGGVRIEISDKTKLYLASKDLETFFESYDDITSLPDGIRVEVNATDLHDALNFVEYVACGKTLDTKSVLFKKIGDGLSVGATDGFRMAVVNNLVSNVDDDIEMAFERASIMHFIRMIEKMEKDVTLSFANTRLFFNDGDFFAGILSTSEYKDMWEVLEHSLASKPDKPTFIPDMEFMKKALAVCSTFAADGAGYILLDLEGSRVLMSSKAEQIGDTRWVMIPKEMNLDEPMKIGVDPSFITQYIAKSPRANIKFFFSDPKREFFIENDNENYQFVAMPIRL